MLYIGACEAVVGSLKRHDDLSEVVFQTCHAIHYLAQTQNNISWIGANGGCECVTIALAKHSYSAVNAVRSACRAIGSLARYVYTLYIHFFIHSILTYIHSTYTHYIIYTHTFIHPIC